MLNLQIPFVVQVIVLVIGCAVFLVAVVSQIAFLLIKYEDHGEIKFASEKDYWRAYTLHLITLICAIALMVYGLIASIVIRPAYFSAIAAG